MDYFHPKFMLGLTATPERMDGRDVYALCDYNVPYELNLRDAINKGMLVPIVSIVLCKPRNRFLVQCIPSTSGCCVSQPGLTVKGAEHRFAA